MYRTAETSAVSRSLDSAEIYISAVWYTNVNGVVGPILFMNRMCKFLPFIGRILCPILRTNLSPGKFLVLLLSAKPERGGMGGGGV